MFREGASYKRAVLVLLGFGGTTCLVYYLYTRRKRDVPRRHVDPRLQPVSRTSWFRSILHSDAVAERAKKANDATEDIVQPRDTKTEEVTPAADIEPSVDHKEDVIVTDDRTTISGVPSNTTTDKPASTSESADSSFEQVPQAPPSVDPSISLESSSTFEKVSLPPSQIPDAAGEPGKSLEASAYEQVSVSQVGAGEAAEQKKESRPVAETPAATHIEVEKTRSHQPVSEAVDQHKSISAESESQRESILEKDENDIVVIETEKHDALTEEKPFELRIDEDPVQSIEDIPEVEAVQPVEDIPEVEPRQFVQDIPTLEPAQDQVVSRDFETSKTEVEDIGASQDAALPQSPPQSPPGDVDEGTS